MKFNRILLKLSGESLAGEQKQGINTERLNDYARQIKEIAEMGVQISAFDIMGYLFYPYLLLVSSLVAIFLIKEKK